MKTRNLIATSSLALTMMLGIVATPLSAQQTYTPGVTVEKNTNPEWEADYTATFIYKDKDARDATNVSVSGGFQFYKPEEVQSFANTGDGANIPCYNAYQYQDGMFAGGYNLNGDAANYSMTEIEDEIFEVTIPLPANEYCYAFNIEYSDGSSETNVKDPANPALANDGSDAGWSLFYVGNGETKGQEYINPRTDGKTGTYSFVNYLAEDGTTQPLGIYLPNGYDANKTYKTIYVSHGGGGNEVEWMTIGAVPNIMDNLIADSLTKEAIVVTMDNTYFNWDYDRIINNLFNNILPYIETHYNVSKEVNDRAFCGLSMGSMTTTTLYQTHPDQFGYFGCFSGANVPVDVSKVAHLDQPNLYITAGCIDMALMNDSYNTASDRTTTGFVDKLNTLNLTNYKLEILNGAHDWYVWRESFTNFVKDHLWTKDVKIETPSETPVIKPETPASSTNTTTAPKTGDDLNLAVAGLFIIISVTTGVVIKKHY